MADNNQKPPVDEVQLQLSELKASIEQQNKVIADQQKTIAALQTKETVVEVKAKKKPEIPKKAVEHDGKKYQFTVPHFRLSGSDEIITSEDAATDKDTIAKILEVPNQGVLKEQF